jgi:hypothetical protein
MTQTPDEQNTAEFQAQLGEQEPDQDSEPSTMAPEGESPAGGSTGQSQAQEPDDAAEASPS